MTYRMVIFDFDGTLADTFPWFASVLNDVAAQYGFRTVAPEDVAWLRTLDSREIIRRLEVPAWKTPLIARHMRKLASAERTNFRLFPGVEHALEALAREGLMLAVASSNSEENVRAVLGETLAGRMQFACGASLFGKARSIAKLVKRASVAPAAALYVGDEIRDAQAARAAGIAFGAVTWGYTAPGALAAAGPDHMFAAPADILALLEKAS